MLEKAAGERLNEVTGETGIDGLGMVAEEEPSELPRGSSVDTSLGRRASDEMLLLAPESGGD